jgi:hypothetical protein
MNKIALTLIFLLTCTFFAGAQTADNFKSETWYRIMHNDTTVSYFTARRDFVNYLREYQKRETAAQSTTQDSKPGAEQHAQEEHLKSPEEAAIMDFKLWSKSIKPFVTPDGKIMTVEQRMALMNKGK